MRRRPQVEWMTQTDGRILEVLAETGMVLSPKILAVDLDYNREWISQRLKPLLEAGLVSKEGKGLYRITDLGRRYLTGEASADEIPTPESL